MCRDRANYTDNFTLKLLRQIRVLRQIPLSKCNSAKDEDKDKNVDDQNIPTAHVCTLSL